MRKTTTLAVSVLAAVMIFASFSSAKALSPPAWVPQTVAGWDLAFNAPVSTNYTDDLNTANYTLVANWSQVWIQNTTNTLTGVVGVVALQYSSDIYGQTLNPEVLEIFKLAFGSNFTGTTVWSFIRYIFIEAGGTDVTSQIPGASGAVELNDSEDGFVLIFAYADTKVMAIFSLDISTFDLNWVTDNDTTDMYSSLGTYIGYFATFIAIFATYFAELASSGTSPATTVASHGISTAQLTNQATLLTFAKTYVSEAAPPSSIPGFSIPLVGVSAATGLAAMVLIVRKRKLSIV